MKWFSHDNNAMDDINVLRLRVKYGNDGYAVFFQFLELQAREEKAVALDDAVALKLMLPLEKVTDIVQDAVRLGLFDKEHWKSGHVYTAKLESRADNYSRRKKRMKEDESLKPGSKLAEWCQKIEVAWHKTKLPKIANWSSLRKDKLSERLRNPYFQENVLTAIEKMGASSFCNGKNDRQWKATIDFLIANDNNFVKALEGKYDNRGSGDRLLEKYGVREEER